MKTVTDIVVSTMQDYIDDFSIDENLDKTLTQMGIDSIDQLELQYFLGEKLDLKNKLPENLKMQQILDFLELNSDTKISTNV
jgi:acyl carrier protein